VEALLPRLKRKTNWRFLDNALKHYASARKGLDELARPSAPIWPPRISRQSPRALESSASRSKTPKTYLMRCDAPSRGLGRYGSMW